MDKLELVSSDKISKEEQEEIIKEFIARLSDVKKVLLLPPDYTRKHSGGGELTAIFYQQLSAKGIEVDVMPAIGTHTPMSEEEILDMFMDTIPLNRFIVHNWRQDTVSIGEVPANFVNEVSGGVVNMPIDVKINKYLISGKYDLIISIGQVLPHEVVGMANYNKNIFVGCGGVDIINKSHFVGAAYGMEKLLGKDHSPVRKIYDYAQKNYLKDLPLHFVLTVNGVVSDKHTGLTDMVGIFIGQNRDVFKAAVELSQKVNITRLDKPLKKVVAYLDEHEFKTTWLGCKAVYRTRMAIADGGELIMIAPGLKHFGEDKEIDKLIMKYGYVGTEKILEYVKRNSDIKQNLSAAAHLIHGSSEGRFKITLACQYLSQKDIEVINFNYMPLDKALDRYKPAELKAGYNKLVDGEEIYFIENPATGLWVAE